MTEYLQFNPPTLIFTASSNSKSSLGLQLTNILTKRPLMFRARMEKQPSCFSISLPNGYGIALHAQSRRDGRNIEVYTSRPEKVLVERVGSVDFLAQSCGGDAVVVDWCAISPAEAEACGQDGKADIWAKAWDRARSDLSIPRGKFRVPIEIFNPNMTANPRQTWKDIGRLTNFIYRPGVENKPATFKPQSVQNYLHGFFERVWDCEAVIEDAGDKRAIKQIVIKEMKIVSRSRTIDLDMERIRKRAQRQFQVWMKLAHPNVASIIGEISHPEISIMTLRYEHSDILDYIQTPGMTGPNRKARCEARSRLIKEVTSGLEYLHSCNIVHGELHHTHVLVDRDGHAKIADYGLAGILAKENVQRPWIGTPGGYFPPEYIFLNTPPMFQSDVYCYGLLLLEASASSSHLTNFDLDVTHQIAVARLAFTGLFPGPAEVRRKMVEKNHLPKPAEFNCILKETGPFWDIFHRCCAHLANERPSMSDISRQIGDLSFLEEVFCNVDEEGKRLDVANGTPVGETRNASAGPREEQTTGKRAEDGAGNRKA